MMKLKMHISQHGSESLSTLCYVGIHALLYSMIAVLAYGAYKCFTFSGAVMFPLMQDVLSVDVMVIGGCCILLFALYVLYFTIDEAHDVISVVLSKIFPA